MTHRMLLTKVASVRRHARRSFSSMMGPVTRFTEDEDMTRETARQWANQELKPVVREMDNDARVRPDILESLFACGFMGMVRVDCFLCSCGKEQHVLTV
jgi:alkylation response protein AidB-like acyl-CoA dehydrogenase